MANPMYISNMSTVWNDINQQNTAIKMNVADFGHADGSKLLDLLLNSNSKMSVDVSGTITTEGNINAQNITLNGQLYVNSHVIVAAGNIDVTNDWPTLVLRKTANTATQFLGQTSDYKNRWLMQIGDNAQETGANTGSDFVIHRYDDGGNWISGAFYIQRRTGHIGLNAIPDASAQFHMESDSAGLLPPRLTSSQRDNISSPATGLIIYNTTLNCLQIYDSSSWKTLSTGYGDSIKWVSRGVGEVVFVDTSITGVDIPLTNASDYRYVQLTYGLSSSSGQYNYGCLTSESLSGSDPTHTATAVVSLSTSPLYGRTIRLLNTERRFQKPSTSAGTIQNDQIQNMTGQFKVAGGNGAIDTTSGVFTVINAPANYPSYGSGSNGSVGYGYFDASRVARAGTETLPKNVGVTAYMRIL